MLQFVKMHGAGNDYVFIDVHQQQVADPAALAITLSDRHRGIGADGLILIGPSKVATVRMVMYNADGSRAQMCGNGIRCVAKYALEAKLCTSPDVTIETDDGVKHAQCHVHGDRVDAVTIDMGEPHFRPEEIPVAVEADQVVNLPIQANGKSFEMTCLSMGNPHAVIFIDDLGTIELAHDGPAIEVHESFPQRVNAHFVQVLEPQRVRIITWERGSGPTQACGTGAAAVCVAGVVTGRTHRQIHAEVPGGELQLQWRPDNHVIMTGPAVEVYRGQWPG